MPQPAALVPAPPAASDQLALRQMTREDIPSICRRFTRACVADLSPDGSDIRNPAELASVFADAYVILRGDEIVGALTCNFDRSFGIWIAPEHRRQGYGAEAVEIFLAAPALSESISGAVCFEDNFPCRRILERNGFVELYRRRLHSRLAPAPRTAVYYRRGETEAAAAGAVGAPRTGLSRFARARLAFFELFRPPSASATADQ